jgi:hypothetical protein
VHPRRLGLEDALAQHLDVIRLSRRRKPRKRLLAVLAHAPGRRARHDAARARLQPAGHLGHGLHAPCLEGVQRAPREEEALFAGRVLCRRDLESVEQRLRALLWRLARLDRRARLESRKRHVSAHKVGKGQAVRVAGPSHPQRVKHARGVQLPPNHVVLARVWRLCVVWLEAAHKVEVGGLQHVY